MRSVEVVANKLADESDAELLRRFGDVRDQAAFACLVARHSRLVLGSCHRMLHNRQDAEDAFQAVFLTLAGKARSLRKVRSLSGWLYGVAVRISLNVRRANRKWRRAVANAEENMKTPCDDSIGTDSFVGSAIALLDEELARLPGRYRDVLVLCDLEGHSQKEAARLLSAPIGTVSSRLVRGRKLLHNALVRRGAVLGTGGLMAIVSQAAHHSPQASAALVQGTVRSAVFFLAGKTAAAGGASARVATLVHELMRALMIANLKLTAFVVSLVVAFAVLSPTVSSKMGLTGGVAKGQTIFFDDFEDGSLTNGVPVTLTDGQPVTWRSELGAALQIQNGSIIVSGLSVPIAIPSIGSQENVSIQVQMRVLEGDYAGIGGRRTLGGQVTNYFAGVGEYLNNGVRTNEAFIAYGGSLEVLHAKDVNFDPKLEDVILQLDIIDNRVTYWAWPADEPRPAEPNGSVVDDTLASGEIFLWASSPGLAGNLTGRAAFRYVHVSTMPIPEPSTAALAAFAPLAVCFWWLRRRA